MKEKLEKITAYMKNPKMTFFVDISDFGESLQNDLDIQENDNCILMTYKLVVNKNEYIDLENEHFESWPVDSVIDGAIRELSNVLNNNHRFRMVATFEKIKHETDAGEQLQYTIHVLVNIRHSNIDALQNCLANNRVDDLCNAKLYSVAICNMGQIKNLPNDTWCISPVDDMKVAVDLMKKQSKKDGELVLLKYDDCEYECPICIK